MKNIPELPIIFGIGIVYKINERLSVKKYTTNVYSVFYLSHEFLFNDEQKFRETFGTFIKSYDMNELIKNSYEVRFNNYIPKSLPKITGQTPVNVCINTDKGFIYFNYTETCLEHDSRRFAFKDKSSAYLPDILQDVFWSLI